MCVEAFVRGVKSNASTAWNQKRGVRMIKDQAVGRLLRLVEQCDAATVVRLADELEDTLEIGPYGVRQFHNGDGPIFANALLPGAQPKLCVQPTDVVAPVGA